MRFLPSFIRHRPGLAFFALLATAGSGFGQTFFIAVFGHEIRLAFELSHSAYGALYSGATLLSALILLRVGGLADRWALHHVMTLAILLLATGCVLLGMATHGLVLLTGFFLVRLGGQGMMSHLGLTTAGRYFHAQRGKVVALTVTGFPIAEALLPAAGVLIIATLGWRSAWLISAIFLVLVMWPLFWSLGRHAPLPKDEIAPHVPGQPQDFERGQVLRDPGFYLLLPAALVTPFVVTGVLFHQAAIAEAREWTMTLIATAFSGYAAGHWLALLVMGSIVDRLGAQRVLPLTLLPMMLAMLLLALYEHDYIPLLYLTLTGFTQGGMSTASGTLWPTRYGVRHLGSIRAMVQAVMVAATALAPVLAGLILDAALGVSGLAWFMLAVTLLSALLALMAADHPRAAVAKEDSDDGL